MEIDTLIAPVHSVGVKKLAIGAVGFLAFAAPSQGASKKIEEPVSLCSKFASEPSALFYEMHMINLKKRLQEIAGFQYNWDGYGGKAPLPETVQNTLAFIQHIPVPFAQLLNADGLYPNPHGTINVEWNISDDQFISVEIGSKELAYFYEIEGNMGESDGNIPFAKEAYSTPIVAALKDLYHFELLNG